jgi:hypothetical protein
MRPLSLLLCAFSLTAAAQSTPPKLTGGTGTIYLASYGKRIIAIDEATEKVAGEIPLKVGLPWAVRMARDGSRFFVQSADQEHFEVIDVGSRQTLDTFTLSEGSKKVRALAFDVDPSNRFMMLVARTVTKLSDRFEIGTPVFIQYDLKEHRVVLTVPWATDPEPMYYYLSLRYSPDGKLLYAFSSEIVVYDATTLKKLDSWDLALPNEPGLGRFDLNAMDDVNEEPGFFTGLFAMEDAVQKRRLLGVGRVDLRQKKLDYFPIGPSPDRGDVSFALSPDRKRGYMMIQEIGQHELWTIDVAGKRLESRVEFKGRPRLALRASSNGKIIYLHQAGNTIDLYDAAAFKYLRTITLPEDMMYGTFYVVPPGRQPRTTAAPLR